MHGILFIPDAYRKSSSQIQMLKAHHSEQIFTGCPHTLFVVSRTICFSSASHRLIAPANNANILVMVYLSMVILCAFVNFFVYCK